MLLCGVDRFKIAAFANQPSRKTTASSRGYCGPGRRSRLAMLDLQSRIPRWPAFPSPEERSCRQLFPLIGDKIYTRILLQPPPSAEAMIPGDLSTATECPATTDHRSLFTDHLGIRASVAK